MPPEQEKPGSGRILGVQDLWGISGNVKGDGMRASRAFGALLVVGLLVAALPAGAGVGTKAGWYRVGFDRTITPGDRNFLDRIGIDSLFYAGDNSYVAWVEPGQAPALRDRGSIASITAVRPAAKIDHSLTYGSDRRITVLARASAIRWSSFGDLLASPSDFSGDGLLQAVELPATRAMVVAAAKDPAVLYVGPASSGLVAEDEASSQIVAGNLTGTTPKLGYEPFLESLGLDGSGVTISINDDGVDATHPEFTGRVAQRISYGPGGNAPSGGHGTHVAGIAAGIGFTAPGGSRFKDGAGFLYGVGIAPGATLVDQVTIALATGDVSDPVELSKYAKDAVGAGAVAWNASWHSGEGTGAGYISNAALLDALVRDADQTTAQLEPLTMVFSAGNAGASAPNTTITSPKEAKNIITVANSGSSRSTVGVNSISSSSSRGPAVDGRILPTVAAPGSTIVSANSTTGTTCDGGVGTYLPFYTTCSGTSMAAPHVTGTVALIHEWWGNNHDGADPSPAMNKALLVNSAIDMGIADIPNNEEGWGRVHLGNLFDPTAQRVMIDQDQLFDGVGDSFTLDVVPADPARPVKATLVWTDPAGLPGAPKALVNDLDLTVQASDGTFWFGNDFAGGWSVPGTLRDDLNNIENVFLQAPSASSYRVKVDAINLPGDGVPGNATLTDQDFALVLSNVATAAPGTFPEGLPVPVGTVRDSGGGETAPVEVKLAEASGYIAESDIFGVITETEFLEICDVPAEPPAGTQGVDGWVFEIPADIAATSMKLWGETGLYVFEPDPDATFYSDTCSSLGSAAVAGPEAAKIPEGTRYIYAYGYDGYDMDVFLELWGPE